MSFSLGSMDWNVLKLIRDSFIMLMLKLDEFADDLNGRRCTRPFYSRRLTLACAQWRWHDNLIDYSEPICHFSLVSLALQQASCSAYIRTNHLPTSNSCGYLSESIHWFYNEYNEWMWIRYDTATWKWGMGGWRLQIVRIMLYLLGYWTWWWCWVRWWQEVVVCGDCINNSW